MLALLFRMGGTRSAHADAAYGLQRTSRGEPLWRAGSTIAMTIDRNVPVAARPVIEAGFHAWEAPTTARGGVAFVFGAAATANVHGITTAWPHGTRVASITR